MKNIFLNRIDLLFAMINEAFILHNVDIEELIASFKLKIQPDAVKNCSVHGHLVHIFILEQYFMRIESNLAAVVILEQKDGINIEVTIAVAGGAHGLLEITWGAEDRMLRDLVQFFQKYQ